MAESGYKDSKDLRLPELTGATGYRDKSVLRLPEEALAKANKGYGSSTLGIGSSGSLLAKSGIGISGVLPSGLTSLMTSRKAKKNGKYVALKSVLDLFFTDYCVWMQDPEILLTKASVSGTSAGTGFMYNALSAIPGFPLVGFTFLPPQNIEILKYTYSEYPYINKAVIANNMMKEPTQITLQALRPITTGNNILANFAANWLGIKYYIEKYCDFGGLWTIITQWGVRSNYLLTDLKGTMPVGNQAGVGFEFTFKRYNFDSYETSQAKNSDMLSVLGGR